MANIDALGRDVVLIDDNTRIDVTVVSAINRLFSPCNPNAPSFVKLLRHYEVLLEASRAVRGAL